MQRELKLVVEKEDGMENGGKKVKTKKMVKAEKKTEGVRGLRRGRRRGTSRGPRRTRKTPVVLSLD